MFLGPSSSMKSKLILFMLALANLLPRLSAETPVTVDETQQLAPYVVKGAPLGYLGIKHATAKLNVLRLITFRGSLEFLQIDELSFDSPGIMAGIKTGDRIIGVDGTPINKWSYGRLKRYGEDIEAGQVMKLQIFRPSDGSTHVIEIVAPKKPKS